MNNNILNLIKEAINVDKESNIDNLYRTIWFNVLEQFKLNNKRDILVLSLTEKVNDYYKIMYYTGKSIVEITFKMTKKEKTELFKLLLSDGFSINDSTISIERNKIIGFIYQGQPQKKIMTVPEKPINMIDEFKIKHR